MEAVKSYLPSVSLETPESWWRISNPSQKAWKQGEQMVYLLVQF